MVPALTTKLNCLLSSIVFRTESHERDIQQFLGRLAKIFAAPNSGPKTGVNLIILQAPLIFSADIDLPATAQLPLCIAHLLRCPS